MISTERREMFADLYRIAECFENPPFKPGDIDGNAEWFTKTFREMIMPFQQKYNNKLAADLVFAITDEASRKAALYNKTPVIV